MWLVSHVILSELLVHYSTSVNTPTSRINLQIQSQCDHNTPRRTRVTDASFRETCSTSRCTCEHGLRSLLTFLHHCVLRRVAVYVVVCVCYGCIVDLQQVAAENAFIVISSVILIASS